MSWAGCQNNTIDVNFHLQKDWKFLKIPTKSYPTRTRRKNVPPRAK